MIWQQYKKELMGLRGDTILIIGALAVLYVFLATRIGNWMPEPIVVLSMMPVGFIHLWVMWASLQLFRREWRENTHYLMLSLPVPAWKITVPKLAALLTGVIGFSVTIFVGVYSLASKTGFLNTVSVYMAGRGVSQADIAEMGFKLFGLILGSFIVLAIMVQLAYLLSRLFYRFQGLLLGVIWLVQVFVIGQLSEWLGNALGWLPGVRIKGLGLLTDMDGITEVALDGGPLWAMLIIGIALFALLNVTLSRLVEAT